MAGSEKGYKNNQIDDLKNISESCIKGIIRGIEYESTAEKRRDLSKEKCDIFRSGTKFIYDDG